MEATSPRVGVQIAESTDVTESQLDIALAEGARGFLYPLQEAEACEPLEVRIAVTLGTTSAEAREANVTRRNSEEAAIAPFFARSPLQFASHPNEGSHLGTVSKTRSDQDTMASKEVGREELDQEDLSHLTVLSQPVDQMTQIDADSESARTVRTLRYTLVNASPTLLETM